MKIVAAVDASNTSANAQKHAFKLAQLLRVDLQLLYVVDLASNTPSLISADPRAIYRDLNAEGEAVLRRAEQNARAAGLNRVTSRITTGLAADGISAAADKGDLIVMGTHGRKGFDHVALGSVAEDVFRSAKAGVVVIRFDGHPSSEVSFRRILVAFDGSQYSNQALTHVLPLASAMGSQVTVAHVERDAQHSSEILAQARQIASKSGASVAEKVLVSSGSPAAALIAESINYDLIVLGSHGRGVLTTMAFGSVTDEVLRNATVPVLAFGPATLD
eukprot:TRINITY_DN7690_c0_g1_i1.p1 TRINITY_DN7690_c0_g1~~TRINITY_DN7690_c0_g1_i1.p1  ORF type:complete len:275 (-),score=63.99 TRINITY_DN7690_c0_g1_i1:33-857(-)